MKRFIGTGARGTDFCEDSSSLCHEFEAGEHIALMETKQALKVDELETERL